MKTHVFRSLPISADSRTSRNLLLFSGNFNQSYTWERELNSNNTTVAFPFKKNGSRITVTFKYILFVLWVPYIILTRTQKYDYAVFMDFETAILGIPAAKIKGVRSVFDIVDPFAQTKVKNKFIQKIFDRIEVFLAELADIVLIPHPCRITYYKKQIYKIPKLNKLFIIENVPTFSTKILNTQHIIKKSNHKIVIGYFGSLDRKKRGLEWLLRFAKQYSRQYEIIIAGQGALADDIRQIALDSDNIKFYGTYNYTELHALYELADFTWAYYSADVLLHHFAAPNKFYEHLFYGKPIITSIIIPHWETIKRLETGICVDCETHSETEFNTLNEKIISFKRQQLQKVRDNTKFFWDEHYNNYYTNVSTALRKNAQRECSPDSTFE